MNEAFTVGAISLATATAFSYVGANYAAGSWGNYLGHAAVGCVSTVARGGNCGAGAASGVLGKFTTVQTDGWYVPAQFVATVVAGGVGSVIGGGKFENGAKTAAYGYLFNNCFNRPGGCRSFAQEVFNRFVGAISFSQRVPVGVTLEASTFVVDYGRRLIPTAVYMEVLDDQFQYCLQKHQEWVLKYTL